MELKEILSSSFLSILSGTYPVEQVWEVRGYGNESHVSASDLINCQQRWALVLGPSLA